MTLPRAKAYADRLRALADSIETSTNDKTLDRRIETLREFVNQKLAQRDVLALVMKHYGDRLAHWRDDPAVVLKVASALEDYFDGATTWEPTVADMADMKISVGKSGPRGALVYIMARVGVGPFNGPLPPPISPERVRANAQALKVSLGRARRNPRR